MVNKFVLSTRPVFWFPFFILFLYLFIGCYYFYVRRDYFLYFWTNVGITSRDGSRAAATSKMVLFVIILNGFQPLTIIIKSSILDVAAVLDPPMASSNRSGLRL